jgi:alkylation response protein AidB-like acyl-CoA dehydrogenase
MGVALEELGRALSPAPVLSSAVGAARALPGVDGEQAARLRAGIAAGTTVAALGVDHARRWPPSAVPVHAADSQLSGAIDWVADAACADVLLVPASDGGALALFTVDKDAPGLRSVAHEHVDGTRRYARVELTATPAECLGPADEGALARTVDQLMVAYVLDGLGAAEAALARAVAYAKERHQFGVPIGTFQAVQHLCADMLRDVETTRAVAYYALWASEDADATEAHRAATMAKAVAAEALPRIGAACIQVHGGIGFTWEHDAHLFHKRLLTVQHVFGTADEHLDELARLVEAAPTR